MSSNDSWQVFHIHGYAGLVPAGCCTVLAWLAVNSDCSCCKESVIWPPGVGTAITGVITCVVGATAEVTGGGGGGGGGGVATGIAAGIVGYNFGEWH